MKKIFASAIALLLCVLTYSQNNTILPDITAKYAVKNGEELYMDIYEPRAGSETEIDGKKKPTIVFMFGGAFCTGTRDYEGFFPWFSKMVSRGYRIVSIDYRLGLKGVEIKKSLKLAGKLENAIQMAAADLFSATNYLIDNAAELGIDTGNIVVSGSSAGAIAALQAEYEICNGTEASKVLPEGFNYAGVMSFSGAVFIRKHKLEFAKTPAPVMMLHGTKDSIVPYRGIKLFGMGFLGSSHIAKVLSKKGSAHTIYRYKKHDHEIAGYMDCTVGKQEDFLVDTVMGGRMEIVDSKVDDRQ